MLLINVGLLVQSVDINDCELLTVQTNLLLAGDYPIELIFPFCPEAHANTFCFSSYVCAEIEAVTDIGLRISCTACGQSAERATG